MHTAAVPDLILWSRPGCHLCEETHALLAQLLDRRRADGLPTPALVEHDITTNPDWERAFFLTIPVVDLGEHRLELATSLAKLRALLATLDAPAPPATRVAAP